jgi:hypothetical protein
MLVFIKNIHIKNANVSNGSSEHSESVVLRRQISLDYDKENLKINNTSSTHISV